MKRLRWGILSTACIARENWRAIRHSGQSRVTAVASREVARSRQFIEDGQRAARFEPAPGALGSYEALLASKEVDAVYIPLPTGLRKEWVLRAAAAGKHILCEKPCGVSWADVREMTEACQKSGVQFMDGVMFMHNPRLPRLRELLDDAKSFGSIRRMMSFLSFSNNQSFFDSNIRVHSALEPAGCLGDLGWYCIRFALWAMNWRLPREVSGQIIASHANCLSPAAVPADLSGELIFDDGASLGFYCSFRSCKQDWAQIAGTAGYLRLNDFAFPQRVRELAIEVNGAEERVKYCDTGGAAQDAQMFRHFAEQVASGKLNRDWPMWSLKTQQVMDACLESARNGGRAVSLQ